ncbi:DNA-3-methyladenine glycosylase I [Biostraticola tofi]|uniref:DNA-3-methyladenine glycosylase I n=1 Tax=Biostraticola tofi TaxID=466109 RepID=A0A4R3YHK3_9GAMM|nr:DNA-3-methyladenine glycosylase I [Biostraticola tofi]TCV91696.1 DNA-3-methyladenine glycosylase I [Biostraticola tofi]
MTHLHKQRCTWAQSSLMMREYHDNEWGVPVKDPRLLWETLLLEGFQAGLSWEIILRKREAFREAFAGFVPERVAEFQAADITRLMGNAGIVRARAKIEATIKGAQIYLAMQQQGEGFSDFCWSFTDGQPVQGTGNDSQSLLSATVSKELKRRGFKFVGPTITFAWMQAVGIIQDHRQGCFRRQECLDATTSDPATALTSASGGKA